MEQDQLHWHNVDCRVDLRFGRFIPRCQICRIFGNDSPPKPCPFVGARPRPTVNCHDQPLRNDESPAARTTTVMLLTRTETFDRSVRTRWNDMQELTPVDPTVVSKADPTLARITVFWRLSHKYCVYDAWFATSIHHGRGTILCEKAASLRSYDSQRNKYPWI